MSTSIVIQELTGSQRIVALGGRALPERPLPAGGRLRTKKTWYAGNNVATLQVLGSEDMDTQIRGVWNDRYIGQQVSTVGFETPELAREVVRIFETLQRSGNALRVQWSDVVRMGVLAEFEPNWLREQDVEWSMRFEWFGRDDQEVSRATLDEPPNSSELRRRQNESDDRLAFEPRSIRTDYSQRVRSQISNVRGKVGAIFDRVRAAQSTAAIPLTAVRGVLADAESLRQLGNELATDLLEAPLGVATDLENLIDRLNAETWRREQGRRVVATQAEGQRVARDLRRLTRPEPIAVITVRGGGDSLRRIAAEVYGTADEWRRIADVNGLPDSVVAPGTLIVIPPLGSPSEDVSC
ncbi:MAG TPA: hypothetical protein ENK57_12290 [Polyangiaceae bacterium]|nr:hypothetical protein [Polyangiaceae bacterium]